MSIPRNGAAATIKYRCFVFDPPKEGDLTIPPSIMELLPGSDISVEQVLQHVFPPVDPDLPAGFAWHEVNKQIHPKLIYMLMILLVSLSAVLAIYMRSGGPNGMHLWVPQTSQLGLVSYVVLQVYQKMPNARAKFRETHYGKSLEIKNFQLVPAGSLIAMLSVPSEMAITKKGDFIELVRPNHIEDMHDMAKILPQFLVGIEAMSKAQRNDTLNV